MQLEVTGGQTIIIQYLT